MPRYFRTAYHHLFWGRAANTRAHCLVLRRGGFARRLSARRVRAWQDIRILIGRRPPRASE
jgi:hypothetical protein